MKSLILSTFATALSMVGLTHFASRMDPILDIPLRNPKQVSLVSYSIPVEV